MSLSPNQLLPTGLCSPGLWAGQALGHEGRFLKIGYLGSSPLPCWFFYEDSLPPAPYRLSLDTESLRALSEYRRV